ncbi:MAG: S9 family peptidase [Bacteroidales bacterium]|nr:S9 family peptidase [Bacteroidales bacterium]MCM1146990.1 S9 family peptidase [Bacteroidales bacterium]MCM1205877.1 S9 family peptidase [Bacillota bacterium]MCM1509882.1 S9 family peptidase [Clostridium sp.]
MKRIILAMAMTMAALGAGAQQKQFTLEDLNFGGKNFRQMSPKYLRLWWNGNTLVNSDTLAKPKGYPQVFAREHNIYIQTSAGNEPQRVTEDGSRQLVYGEAVHRNEFGINSGIFLSPDKSRFAFYRMDQSMVTDYPQVNTFERIAVVEPDAYPMAGMKSHKVTVGVYDIKTQKTVWLDLGDVTDRYFTNITWSPDNKSVYLFEVNRDQTDTSLDVYDALTGKKVKTLYTEHCDKYVEPQHPVTFLPWDDGKFILWSERDGYNHLYLYNTDGKLLKQLTKGNYVDQEIVGFCGKTKSVIIRSNELNPLQSNLFALSMNGRRTLLDNGKGVHRGILSDDGTRLVDVYSAPDVPRAYEIINTVKKTREEYFTSPDPWEGYAVPAYKSGSIKAADGVTDLYYRLVLPPDFDENKKYPTVVYVYGGPHAHNVEASWHWASRSWETYMAQKGYVIFVLDNRGSENRGREFEQATFRKLGQEEMKDQMKGVDFLKTLPYVDMDRLGVHGWSFGGFMTTSLMTTYLDVFKVGVAGGPVIDWKWYEVMYGERYMDTPDANPEGYAGTSLLEKAKNLKGKLQIIIGMNDPTVVPQHALQFLDACIKAGTQPDFFVYPGEGHNMMGHASVHLHERITQYFEDYLK